MASTSGKTDRNDTAPFHLKVFYRIGSFHRLEEFVDVDYSSPSFGTLPAQHISLSLWPSCSLGELTHLFVAELNDPLTSPDPTVLPTPAVGTRLAFRLVYPDPAALRGGPSVPTRYTSKELGSVVIGGDGMGHIPEATRDRDTDEESGSEDGEGGAKPVDANGSSGSLGGESGSVGYGSLGGDPDRTLADARFVIGDLVSVAILPPGSQGEIASASAAKGGLPASSASGGLGRRYDADDRGTNGWHADGRGRRRQGSGGGQFGGIGGQLPRGDWRRGERLPPLDSRGYGRGRRGHWE